MARRKSSSFGVTDDLFPANNINNQNSAGAQETHDVHEMQKEYKELDVYERREVQDGHEVSEIQEVQRVHEEQDAHNANIETKKVLGSTQGRKGEKLKRINLAFTDENYEYVRLESRRRGKNITEFVNGILEEYKMSDKGRISDSEIR